VKLQKYQYHDQKTFTESCQSGLSACPRRYEKLEWVLVLLQRKHEPNYTRV
jgi:hypothetical protein